MCNEDSGEVRRQNVFLPLYHPSRNPSRCRLTDLNGTGKSTLLRIIVGIEKEFAGDVLYQRSQRVTAFGKSGIPDLL
jgi:ABC-type transport system involved in cytochrome c biogenesis ATPase subunit